MRKMRHIKFAICKKFELVELFILFQKDKFVDYYEQAETIVGQGRT